MTANQSRRSRNALCTLAVTLLALGTLGEITSTGPLMLGDDEAHAIVGRPLTPVSYAGVARRTTRRAAYAGATGYGYGAYAPSATVVTAPPPGCPVVQGVYQCGGTSYAPAYNGATVVYQAR